MRGWLLAFLVLVALVAPVAAGEAANETVNETVAASNTTAAAPPAGATATPAAGAEGGDIFARMRDALTPEGNVRRAVNIVGAAILAAVFIYIVFYPRRKARGSPVKAYAREVSIAPPRGYDFLAYVVDDNERIIDRDYYIKISENLYLSTVLNKPSFLYVPDAAQTYMCRMKKHMVPCGIAYRKGMLTMLVDPELSAAHTLAEDAGIIRVGSEDLAKLLSELYSKSEKKVGFIPISPETRIAFAFNVASMIKGHLNMMRNADAMMMHFLQTANQAESIERFINAATQMQKARYGWMRWLVTLMLAAAIAIGLVMMLAGGG